MDYFKFGLFEIRVVLRVQKYARFFWPIFFVQFPSLAHRVIFLQSQLSVTGQAIGARNQQIVSCHLAHTNYKFLLCFQDNNNNKKTSIFFRSFSNVIQRKLQIILRDRQNLSKGCQSKTKPQFYYH